jgi:multidrug efflux pump subunit AcrA (membrane-fusion protein)
MTAAAMILIKDNSESSFILPASAVVPTPEGELAVWVYNPQTNEVSRRIIQTLAPVHNGVPVVAGLKDGEQVVVAGAGQLQAGMKVRPIDG